MVWGGMFNVVFRDLPRLTPSSGGGSEMRFLGWRLSIPETNFPLNKRAKHRNSRAKQSHINYPGNEPYRSIK